MEKSNYWNLMAVYPHAARAIEVAMAADQSILFIGHPQDTYYLHQYCIEEKIKVYNFSPCECGYYNSPIFPCSCEVDFVIKREREISTCGADVVIEVPHPNPNDILRIIKGEYYHDSESKMKERVTKSQGVRVEDTILPECESLLSAAIRKIHLNLWTMLKVMERAKAIARLEGAVKIKVHHLAEALQYLPRIK